MQNKAARSTANQKTLSRRSGGFTLIELLVVIAIIAILAAILFPVFAQAKESAKKAADLSNGRQIGMGIMQYCVDNDDRFPHISFPISTNTWVRHIQPYVKNLQVFRSPVDVSTNWPPAGMGIEDPNFPTFRTTSYFLNAYLSGAYLGSGPFSSVTTIASPANTIIMATSTDGIVRDHFAPFFWDIPQEQPDAFMASTWDPVRREPRLLKIRAFFNQGANYAYCDGHAKYSVFRRLWWRDIPNGIFAGTFDPRNDGRQ